MRTEFPPRDAMHFSGKNYLFLGCYCYSKFRVVKKENNRLGCISEWKTTTNKLELKFNVTKGEEGGGCQNEWTYTEGQGVSNLKVTIRTETVW